MVNASIVVTPFFKWHFCSPRRVLVVCSLEQMRLIRRAWLYGIVLVKCFRWQLCGNRYWGLFVGLLYMSNTIFTGSVSIQKEDVSSGCFMSEFYSGVNIVGMVKETIEGFFRLGPLHVNVVYETKPGKWLVGEDCIICFSSFPMKVSAYEDAIFVLIAVPLICKICSPLNVKLLCFSINVSNWTRPSVGDSLTALWSQASQCRHYVGC